jgi:myosin heavy chain 9/10/11/14
MSQWEERLVHFQYLQELLEDRRVLVVGIGNGRGVDLLAGIARQVLVVDPRPEMIDRCMQTYSWTNVEMVAGDPDGPISRDDAFDVVIVPELERWVTRGALLPEIRRVLSPDGLVVFCVRSGDRDDHGGMAYADLDEYLAQSFEHVRMLGAIPFQGHIVADFDPDDELDPQLDCSLVEEDEEPDSYLAICSNEPIPSPGYSVLQVPGPSLGGPLPLSDRTRSSVEAWADSDDGPMQSQAMLERLLQRESARVELLEERLEQSRVRFEEASARAMEASGKLEAEHHRAELSEQGRVEWQGAAAEHRKRAEAAERRCDALLIRAEQGAAELSSLHQRMAELQGLRQADQWHIDELTGRLRQTEGRIPAASQDEGHAGGVELQQASARIAELEQQLAAAGGGDAEARGAAAVEQLTAAQEQIQHLEQEGARQLEEKAELEKELMKSESRVEEHTRRATNAESKIVEMEVRLKRTTSEAATLSKWAEELRDELAESQGKSKVIPVTPEPEVAALRNDLREAAERITTLEGRCDRLMAEADQLKGQLADREHRLKEALRAAGADVQIEVQELRAQVKAIPQLRERASQAERDVVRVATELRDAEQALTELQQSRQDLADLRHRVKDVDAASEELEQLRAEEARRREVEAELGRLQEQLDAARIELARRQDEARGGLPKEAGWEEWEDEDEQTVEVEHFVSPDLDDPIEVDEDEEPEDRWDRDERARVVERQIEALLEGAALHREEMERLQAQAAEMNALVEELQRERRDAEQQLVTCQQRCSEDQQTQQQVRDENLRLGRDLARVQGELQRCQEELGAATSLGVGPALSAVETVETPEELQEDYEREVRARRRLQEDLEARLAELDEMRKEVRDKDRAFDRLRTEDTEQRAELRELRRQVRDLERKAAAYLDEASDRAARVEQLEGDLSVDVPSEGAGQLDEQLARALERQRQLELQIEADRRLRDESQQEIERRQAAVETLQDQLADAGKTTEGLQDELGRCRGGAASLEQRLERALEERDQQEEELRSGGQALATCKEQAGALEQQLAERKERIGELKRSVDQERRLVRALRRAADEGT